MLLELAVVDLGVIEELSLVLGPGMTALTGETGAGKTLVVEAIELLVGGRADPVLVRGGRREARVEGRFVIGDEELVLSRVVPRDGRSRAYVNGRLATAAALAEAGAGLVDLHGQHSHQSLLSMAEQRRALDRFGDVDISPLDAVRAELADVEARLAGLGGDARTRAREADLLRYQVGELDGAALHDAAEDLALEQEEDVLAGAEGHREAAAIAHAHLAGEGGAVDDLGAALAAVAGRPPFAEAETRLRGLAADVGDLAADLRAAAETIEADPDRLEAVRGRRRLLQELRRKYGETLDDVIAYREEARTRLEEIDSHEERAAQLERQRTEAE